MPERCDAGRVIGFDDPFWEPCDRNSTALIVLSMPCECGMHDITVPARLCGLHFIALDATGIFTGEGAIFEIRDAPP